jgi:hypothetical protein
VYSSCAGHGLIALSRTNLKLIHQQHLRKTVKAQKRKSRSALAYFFYQTDLALGEIMLLW